MKITGTARDAKTREPLGEAKITLKVGTTEIATLKSDAKGHFAYEAAADYIGETLTCTAEKEGFKTETLTHKIEEEIIPLEIAMEAPPPPPPAPSPIWPKILIGAGIGIVVIALALVGVWWFFIREKPPLTPSELVATVVSPSQIDLTWVDKSDNEDGFRVFREDSKIEVKADEEGYQDKNLEPDTEYTYLVRAFNDAGESDASNQVSVITLSLGKISVTSTPSGASIYLNNQPKGTTPRTIPDLSPGTYTLRVAKTGYDTKQQSVTVTAGETTSIPITLTRQVGTIAVTSTPSGAAIYLNNQPKGTTPRAIPDLSPGTYTLRVAKSGYQSHQQSVTVRAGQTTPLRVTLKKSVPQVAKIGRKIDIGSAFGDRDVFDFRVIRSGTIKINVSWVGANELALILNGPGQVGYYDRKGGRSPLSIVYKVTPEILQKGNEWKASVVNFSRRGRATGEITIEYPALILKVIPALPIAPIRPIAPRIRPIE